VRGSPNAGRSTDVFDTNAWHLQRIAVLLLLNGDQPVAMPIT